MYSEYVAGTASFSSSSLASIKFAHLFLLIVGPELVDGRFEHLGLAGRQEVELKAKVHKVLKHGVHCERRTFNASLECIGRHNARFGRMTLSVWTPVYIDLSISGRRKPSSKLVR
jgi:hypothetical protein